jgi:hypothetical protein
VPIYGRGAPYNFRSDLKDPKADYGVVGSGKNVAVRFKAGTVEAASYLQFQSSGGFQDAFKNEYTELPVHTSDVREGERGWMVPLQPGRTLYFCRGRYLGGSAFKPSQDKDVEKVELKPGMGLLFNTPDAAQERRDGETLHEGGQFLGAIPLEKVKDFKPSKFQVLIIVPEKLKLEK